MNPSFDAEGQSGWWLADESGRTTGPLSLDLLVRHLQDGDVPRGALVCEVGTGEWRRLGDVAVLVEKYGDRSTSLDWEHEVTAVAVPRPSSVPAPRFFDAHKR